MEEWFDVKGYEGLYKINKKGEIKSLKRNVHNSRRELEEKILSQRIGTKGYYSLTLSKEGKKRHVNVHRLLAEVFLEKVEGKNQVNHKDGNKLNNSLENLEWCNAKENTIHSRETQLYKNRLHLKKYEMKERYLKEDISIYRLCKEYKVSQTAFTNFLRRESVKIKKVSRKSKFGIKNNELIALFEKGLKNKEIAEMYSCSQSMIATKKMKWKKGELNL